MKNIKKDLEQKDIKRAYLIFGEERFLVRSAKNMLLRGLVTEGDTMNFTGYSGRECNAPKIIDLAETLPFFADYRVILVEDSGWFKTAADEMAEYVRQIPESTCIIFVETEVDKRNKLYKQVKTTVISVNVNGQQTRSLPSGPHGILQSPAKRLPEMI